MAASPLVVDDEGSGTPHPLAWATPLIPVAASVFGMSALLYYKIQAGGDGPGRNFLQSSVVGLYHGLGFVPSFMLCILVLSWSSIWFITGKLEQPWGRLLRILTASVALALLVNLGSSVNPDGGALGHFLVPRLVRSLGFTVTTILVVATTVAAMLLATDCFFYRHFESLGREVAERARGSARGSVAEGFAASGMAATDSLSAAFPTGGSTTLERDYGSAVGPEETSALDSPALGIPEAGLGLASSDEEASDSARDERPPLGAALQTPPEAAAASQPSRAGWRTRLRIRLDDPPSDIPPVEVMEAPASESDDSALVTEAPQGTHDAARGALDDRSPDSLAAAEQLLHPDPVQHQPLAPAESEMAIIAAALSEPEPPEPAREPTPERQEAEDGHAAEDAAEEPWHERQGVILPAPAAEPLAASESDSPRDSTDSGHPDDLAATVIPRPEPATPAVRQGSLFGGIRDDAALLEEAKQLVLLHRRANAAFLRNRLRVRYEDALEILQILAERGVIQLDDSGTQARVLIGD